MRPQRSATSGSVAPGLAHVPLTTAELFASHSAHVFAAAGFKVEPKPRHLHGPIKPLRPLRIQGRAFAS